MNHSHLSIEYSTAIYNSKGRLSPDSPLNRISAMEGIFCHLSAIGKLMALVDEGKLENMNDSYRVTMMEGLGSLCSTIADAGYTQLMDIDWQAAFGIEEEEEQESEPQPSLTEPIKFAVKSAAA